MPASLAASFLAPADWAVILLYLGGSLPSGCGPGAGRGPRATTFWGSKNLPWWSVGFSIVATETSALTFLGVPAMAYGPDDLTFIQIILGYVLARVVLAVVLVPHYFRGDLFALPTVPPGVRPRGAAHGRRVLPVVRCAGGRGAGVRELHSTATHPRVLRGGDGLGDRAVRGAGAGLHTAGRG
ncbi:MAG: hypothetical protein M5U12_30385 [Verrucomicrobia bacterium]|nr:hypothetical protein [Verrucomicrobiota bacterium]